MSQNGQSNGKKSDKQRPVHEIRLGRIRAAVWQNTTDNGVRHNVTLSRLYKDDEQNQWRDSTSFGRDDLPLVAKVADQAFLWIHEQARPRGAPSGDSSAEPAAPVGVGAGTDIPF